MPGLPHVQQPDSWQLQQPTGMQQDVAQPTAQLQECMQLLLQQQALMNGKLAADIQVAMVCLEAAVWRLQLELSSGGNIRLEEVHHDSSWATFCQDLLRSRFVAAGEAGGTEGITGLQVKLHQQCEIPQQGLALTVADVTSKAMHVTSSYAICDGTLQRQGS